MRNKIAVIGGHGQVGQYIVSALKDKPLVLMGRSEIKMKDFLEKKSFNFEVRVMDINQIDTSLFEDIYAVMVCVDQKTTRLAEYCEEHAILYMDVTANSDYINTLQTLNIKKTTILIGVGIAPGLSNLLAQKILSEHQSSELSLEVILGLGDQHGDEAITWTIDQMLNPYQHRYHSLMRPMHKASNLIYEGKRYPTYNFNFVDQHRLNTIQDDTQVTTYFGFDIPIATHSVAFLAKTRLIYTLKWKWVQRLLRKMMKQPKFGSDQFIVQVHNQEISYTVIGHDEAQMTGRIAGLAAKRLVENIHDKGLIDLSQVVSLEALVDQIGMSLVINK